MWKEFYFKSYYKCSALLFLIEEFQEIIEDEFFNSSLTMATAIDFEVKEIYVQELYKLLGLDNGLSSGVGREALIEWLTSFVYRYPLVNYTNDIIFTPMIKYSCF